MKKVYAYTCLLSALSVVAMKTLYINGRVGGSVTFNCSDWDVWTDVTSNVKYFCDSPCSEDKHIIIKAAFGKTTNHNRIELTNIAESLFVTFSNLQKSDSKTYYCGLERSGLRDPLIKVNLQVTDGYVPYLIAGLIFIITVVMVGMILTRKIMKKQQMVVSTSQEDTRESAGPDEVYQSLQPLTMENDQVYSTLTPTQRSAGPDEVYQSLHPLAMDNDQVYCSLTPTQRSAGPDEVYQSLHPLTMDNDQDYSTLTPTQRV